MSGCLSEALKRLEKWAAENQWISKASARSCIWKRATPWGSTGQDWLARKQQRASRTCRVLADNKWKMLPASASAAEKATCVLGCASNTAARQAEDVVFLHLHTEHHPQFWAPQYKKDAVRLEQVQDLEQCVLLVLKGGSKGEISLLSSTT